MDVAEPPRIVVESHASCANAERAEELLHDALGAARAPGHAWTVTMRVQPAADHALRAAGRNHGRSSGLLVADRVLSVPAGDCQGLARAVGVWASLVLEQELARRRRSRRRRRRPPRCPRPRPRQARGRPLRRFARSPIRNRPTALWPAPAPVREAAARGRVVLAPRRRAHAGDWGRRLPHVGGRRRGDGRGEPVRHHRGRARRLLAARPFLSGSRCTALEQPS